MVRIFWVQLVDSYAQAEAGKCPKSASGFSQERMSEMLTQCFCGVIQMVILEEDWWQT